MRREIINKNLYVTLFLGGVPPTIVTLNNNNDYFDVPVTTKGAIIVAGSDGTASSALILAGYYMPSPYESIRSAFVVSSQDNSTGFVYLNNIPSTGRWVGVSRVDGAVRFTNIGFIKLNVWYRILALS